jgi:hypothetical protein
MDWLFKHGAIIDIKNKKCHYMKKVPLTSCSEEIRSNEVQCLGVMNLDVRKPEERIRLLKYPYDIDRRNAIIIYVPVDDLEEKRIQRCHK